MTARSIPIGHQAFLSRVPAKPITGPMGELTPVRPAAVESYTWMRCSKGHEASYKNTSLRRAVLDGSPIRCRLCRAEAKGAKGRG